MIPIHELPYPLPEHWQWKYLDSIAEIIMGQSPIGDATSDDASYTPLIGGATDMGDLFPTITRYTKKPTKLSKKDDVIICVRATLGKPIFSDGEYCLGRGVAALRPRAVSKDFLRYALTNFEQYLYDNAKGSTFLQIASKLLKRMPIPLPPLDEQQRIVALLDELFGKLDEAKALAQARNYGARLSYTKLLPANFPSIGATNTAPLSTAGRKNFCRKCFCQCKPKDRRAKLSATLTLIRLIMSVKLYEHRKSLRLPKLRAEQDAPLNREMFCFQWSDHI